MLQLNFIRENIDLIKERLVVRNFKNTDIIDTIVKLDDQRKQVQYDLDAARNESKTISKQIGQLFKEGKQAEAAEMREKTTVLKEKIKDLEIQQDTTEKHLTDVLLTVPNIPHPTVPTGNSDADNVEVKSGGTIPKLHDGAKPHWDLIEEHNLVSLELGNKITGAGFPVYLGKGARLQRALVSFFLDEASKNGFLEVIPPFMVNEATAYGTGQLPDKEGQMYHAQLDNFYLIPTSEVPVTNIYRDVIVKNEDLPIKLTAHSPCFRREAGSYGKDVRGLNRVHQFEKVEIVQIAHPDKSYEVLDEMVAYVESLVNKLNLPYRIVRLCGGDLGFTSALTFDFEVYAAAQDKWLEVSSVSNFETFQSNRMKIRFKNEDGKNQLAHTLNGSALALPRILASILENNQTPEGIVIPEVLRKYTGFDVI